MSKVVEDKFNPFNSIKLFGHQDYFNNLLKLYNNKRFPKVLMLSGSKGSGKFTLAFVGYGDEADTAVIELTHNWEVPEYDMGDGFGHIALGVPDIYSTCRQLRESGARIIREPGPMKHGKTIIAFIEDPDGYQLELIER